MNKKLLIACVVLVASAGQVQAEMIVYPVSLTATIADTFVYEYATNSKNPHDLFLDQFNVTTTPTTRSLNYNAAAVARGLI